LHASAHHGALALHFQGVVHNDLKPDNILIAHDGRAVISDFGVSRVHPNKSDTSVGSPGTPTYTAPEVWGVGSYAAIPSDVWSLGVTLHAMVFGCLPYFGASQMELIELVTNPKEWECSHACDDAELLALLRGMMQKVPGARARRSPSIQVLTTAPTLPHRCPARARRSPRCIKAHGPPPLSACVRRPAIGPRSRLTKLSCGLRSSLATCPIFGAPSTARCSSTPRILRER
jgi:eukaryotic-like serine/threonine-protein kinase